MKFFKIKDLVEKILIENEATRNSDGALYFFVCTYLKGNDLTFESAMLKRAELDLPSFETVVRARRKLQEEFPHLRAKKDVEEGRAELEQEFRAIAVGKAADI